MSVRERLVKRVLLLIGKERDGETVDIKVPLLALLLFLNLVLVLVLLCLVDLY